jgi:hypothetical protein
MYACRYKEGMDLTLSIRSGGVTTLDYPIRKEYSGVQLVFSSRPELLASRKSASKRNGLADHPRCYLAGSNTNFPGLCLISCTIYLAIRKARSVRCLQ